MPCTRVPRLALALVVLAALVASVGRVHGDESPRLWAPVVDGEGVQWLAVARHGWPGAAFDRASRQLEIELDGLEPGQALDLHLFLPEGQAALARWTAEGAQPAAGQLALVVQADARAELLATGGQARVVVTASAPVGWSVPRDQPSATGAGRERRRRDCAGVLQGCQE